MRKFSMTSFLAPSSATTSGCGYLRFLASVGQRKRIRRYKTFMDDMNAVRKQRDGR